MKMETYHSVWDAIENTPQDSQRQRLKAEMMLTIQRIIEERDLTQKQAAQICSVSRPRISDLMRGKIGKFSLDSLLDILTRLDCKVSLSIER